MALQRLDQALVDRGLAPSRTRAAALVAAGSVTVDGEVATKPARRVRPDDAIVVTATDRYVSRAAHKLLGALAALDLHPYGRALDAGASTGGFSQVLLERGATRVYAVDVGHDQLHPMIRNDPRVTVREGLNLRDLRLSDLDDAPVDWLVADVSFISLTLLVAPLLATLTVDGTALLMVKPQFEVGRAGLDDRGVVRNPELRAAGIDQVVAAAADLGWVCHARVASTLPGEYGNREEFVHLRRDGRRTSGLDPLS